MMTRNDKIKILERFENKEEKILISNILDKAYRYERENKLFHTNFLNLYELQISTKILDSLNITYYVYTPNEFADKKPMFSPLFTKTFQYISNKFLIRRNR